MNPSEIEALRREYDASLKLYKRSLYRYEWIKRRMLAAEDSATHEKLCKELLRQEADAAWKLQDLESYDYQLTQLRMSTLLRNFEKEIHHDKLFAD